MEEKKERVEAVDKQKAAKIERSNERQEQAKMR
jgi:hypothetical protein